MDLQLQGFTVDIPGKIEQVGLQGNIGKVIHRWAEAEDGKSAEGLPLQPCEGYIDSVGRKKFVSCEIEVRRRESCRPSQGFAVNNLPYNRKGGPKQAGSFIQPARSESLPDQSGRDYFIPLFLHPADNQPEPVYFGKFPEQLNVAG